MATSKQELQRAVNDTHADLTNLELGISALIRQGMTYEARELKAAANIVRDRLQDAREALAKVS